MRVRSPLLHFSAPRTLTDAAQCPSNATSYSPERNDADMANRLIELAIEALEERRSAIDREITALRAGFRAGMGVLTGTAKKGRKAASAAAPTPKRKRSAASRKAQSLKMKAYWAKRRAEKAASAAKQGRRKAKAAPAQA